MQLTLPPVIAHRGASGTAPENTLLALQQAAAAGARWVEGDVRLSKDQQLIIFHDDDLKRTAGINKLINAAAWDELQNIDIGSWLDSKFSSARILSFESYIQTLTDLDLQANIEFKTSSGDDIEILVAKALASLDLHWPAAKPLPLLSSFDSKVLAEINKQDSKHKYPIGLLLDEWRDDALELAEKYFATTIHFNQQVLTAQRTQQLAIKYPILSYTVNDPERAKQLWQQGVTSVFSDDPEHMLAAFKSMQVTGA